MGETIERYGESELGLEFVDDGRRAAVVVTDPIKKSMEAFTFPSRVLMEAWSNARRVWRAMEETKEKEELERRVEAAERRFRNIIALLMGMRGRGLTPGERDVLSNALQGLDEVQGMDVARDELTRGLQPVSELAFDVKGESVEHDIRSLGHKLRVLAGKYKEIQGPASPVAEKLIAISLGEDKD